MKLAELFSHGHSGYNVKREYAPETGNRDIVYLGTDAIAKSHSGPFSPTVPVSVQKKAKRNLRAKSADKMSAAHWKKFWNKEGGEHGGETLWLDNPTSTRCSSCGY